MTASPSHRPCVSIVVIRSDAEGKGKEVLIVHKPRRRDAWQIPQGGIEEGETPIEAARRELLEETGIDLKDPHAIFLCEERYQYDYPAAFKRREKPKYEGQCLLFVVTKISRSVPVKVDMRELNGYRWISPKDLGRYLRRQQYRSTVEQVIAAAG